MIDSAEQLPDEYTKINNQWKRQFYVLCGMLFLALVGMGLTQAMEKGAWEYWAFVVLVYAGLGMWRSIGKQTRSLSSLRDIGFFDDFPVVAQAYHRIMTEIPSGYWRSVQL